MADVIPPITDPLGRYWDQPAVDSIVLDEIHALMDEATFGALHEYSTTLPTGVYPGKMWRARSGGKWFLRWYGLCDDPTKCSNNQRAILLAGPTSCADAEGMRAVLAPMRSIGAEESGSDRS